MNRTVDQPSRGVSLLLRQTYEHHTLGLFTALRRRWLLIGTVVAAAAAVSAGVSLLLSDKYTAEALVQVELGRPGPQPSAQAGTATLEGSVIVESEARVLRSAFIAQRVAQDLGLERDAAFAPRPSMPSRLWSYWVSRREVTETGTSAERIARELSRNLKVTNDARAYLISVAYTSGDPDRSARIANAFVDAYMRNRLEIGVASAERTSAWLQEQVTATRASLDEAEAAIERFRQRTGTVEGSAGNPNLAQQELRDATTRLGTAVQNRLAAEARLARARDAFAAGSVPSAQDLAGAPVIQRLLEAVETANRDLQTVSATGPRHPGYLTAKASLEGVQERLRREIEQAIGNLEGDRRTALEEEALLAAQVETLKKGVIEAMGHETQLQGLQAGAAAIRERLKLLNDSFAQAVALAGMRSSTTQAIMPAQPDTVPSGPNRAFIVGLSVLAASGAGLCAAIMLERHSTGFRSPGDLVEDTGTRCLGMLPKIHRRSTAGERRMFDEAIGLVGASLGWSRTSPTPQILLVASAVPGEGKSLLCGALANALTERGLRVLVIDGNADADPPDDRPDLGSVVSGDVSMFLSACPAAGQTVLRGRVGGSRCDLYATPAFARFIDLAREAFDLVLIEAPPVLLFQEAVTLAHHADATLLAARWKRTPREVVLTALQRLQDQTVRVRGIVLTEVDVKDHRRDRIIDQCTLYGRYRQLFETRAAVSPLQRETCPRLDAKAS
jgi:succinoglycan biosynthesis transport protein ExoP